MPNLDERWHPRKRPTLQIQILKHIAMKGQSSQIDVSVKFGCKPSTISDAFKILKQRGLIIKSIKPPDLKSGVRRRKSYKLSDKGLTVFISENPSPYEFWIAIAWYFLNFNAVDQVLFNKYYDSFIQKFVGDSFPLRSCFFLSDSFDRLFEKWGKQLEKYNDPRMTAYYYQHDPIQACKVIECLSQNRAITIKQIAGFTQLTEQEVRNVLNDYSITQSNYYHYVELYDSVYRSDRSINATTDFLNHLVIIPIRTKEVKQEAAKYDTKDQKFELSLLGILLTMGTISLRRRQGMQKILSSTYEYYDKIASNYQDKLPLIFGKWKLLKQVLKSKFDFYPSILDYLFLHKYEILSLSTLLGGNKEIYDNIKSAALNTINTFSIIYNDGVSAMESEDFPKEFVQNEHYKLMQDKLNDIEISLRYSDLESFAKHIKNTTHTNSSLIRLPPNMHIEDIPKPWTFAELYAKYSSVTTDLQGQENPSYFEDDLRFIENALAEEFSLLFYIGLLRDNDHKASDYPLTTGFIKSSPNLMYPKDFLLDIVRSDDKISKKIVELIREAITYQRLALEKMSHTCEEIEKQRLRKTNKILQK